MKINITIDRFEGEVAVLNTESGYTINWPKEELPKNVKEGSALNFIITETAESEDEKKELTKNILNELLQTEKDKE